MPVPAVAAVRSLVWHVGHVLRWACHAIDATRHDPSKWNHAGALAGAGGAVRAGVGTADGRLGATSLPPMAGVRSGAGVGVASALAHNKLLFCAVSRVSPVSPPIFGGVSPMKTPAGGVRHTGVCSCVSPVSAGAVSGGGGAAFLSRAIRLATTVWLISPPCLAARRRAIPRETTSAGGPARASAHHACRSCLRAVSVRRPPAWPTRA